MRRPRDTFRKNEDGSSSIEFIIVFPVIMWFVLTTFEMGLIATRMVMLEHGLDMAARDIRLGSPDVATHDGLKRRVCEHAQVLNNCERDLILEVVQMDLNSSYPQNEPNCIDRTGEIEPTISFTPGGRSRIMFVRACVIIDPLFPSHNITLGLPRDSTGGLQLVAFTAFMNEPP
jgi:hypothetical protein